MYKVVYICDCCGAEMKKSLYTLHLQSNSNSIQDRMTWHYCVDCWEDVKKRLTLTKSEIDNLILKKAVAKFKEANKEWDQVIKWYEPLFALDGSAQQEKDENDSFYTDCDLTYHPITGV